MSNAFAVSTHIAWKWSTATACPLFSVCTVDVGALGGQWACFGLARDVHDEGALKTFDDLHEECIP